MSSTKKQHLELLVENIQSETNVEPLQTKALARLSFIT